MYACHLFTVVLQCEIEGKSANTLSLGSGGNLQTLNDTGIALMFKTGVFSFGVFTYDSKVDIGMSGGESRKRLAKDDGGINVKVLAYFHVP